MSLRSVISLRAIKEWYTILYDYRFEKRKPSSLVCDYISVLLTELETYVLWYPRADAELRQAIVITWALAYLFVHRADKHLLSKPLNEATSLPDLALLAGQPFTEQHMNVPGWCELAPLARQSETQVARVFVLNSEGRVAVYARFHLCLTEAAYTEIPWWLTALPPQNITLWMSIAEIVHNSLTITRPLFQRLDYMFTCGFILPLDMYLQPVPANPFILINEAASLDPVRRLEVNTLIFDHAPDAYRTITCPEVALGMLTAIISLMCRGHVHNDMFALLFEDEVLFKEHDTRPFIIWLRYNARIQEISYISKGVIVYQDAFNIETCTIVLAAALKDMVTLNINLPPACLTVQSILDGRAALSELARII